MSEPLSASTSPPQTAAAGTTSVVEHALAACLARHKVSGSVTIALSGGVDSMVLLDAAVRLRRAATNNDESRTLAWKFDALHVHHGISPNADSWALFCQQACEMRDVNLQVVKVTVNIRDTDGLGIEGAARRARYAAFQKHGAAVILAAQHADDQAETVLHQMLRGTGLAGLSGMGDMRLLPGGQRLLRPLLHLSRANLLEDAKRHQLTWVEDESNADTTYTRNDIRHNLMPQLQARFPHAVASLNRTARHAAEAAEMLEALAKIDLRWDGTVAVATHLDGLPLARQSNALYHYLSWHQVEPPSHAQLEEWSRQLFRPSPLDRPHQAGGHQFVVRRRGDIISLERVSR
jgi:tRNA(Ile)-lysidine synthase